MSQARPLVTSRLSDCIEFVHQRLGNHWVLGAPLGLGKPNHLVNAFYQYAKDNPSVRLDIFTALSLNPPKPAKGLKQRFLGPFVARQFGDYPRLQYLHDLDQGAVPDNITVSEFYFRSGTRLRDPHAQRHYVSANYTHVARDMQAKGINILVQQVGTCPERPGRYSLACNPDITLDLRRRVPREQLLLVAQINNDLPYMEGDAELDAGAFDLVLEGHPQPLFAVPRMPVSDADFCIGLHASQLIRDGGTLQLGIGSLGDAVSFFTVMRQRDNPAYIDLLDSLDADRRTGAPLREDWGGTGPFRQGLYAASEMFTEGFLHMYQAGVLKRRVYDRLEVQQRINQGEGLESLGGTDGRPLESGAVLHAAFFLGSQWMYDTLKNMSREERGLFRMCGVERINQLYGNEALDRAQRREGRFINTTMKISLLGAAVSDQLEDGQVVSGVGGQYNFVAMAHALERGRSILMLRSHRGYGGEASSNIVWEFPHATIPRHLRDIVITEYGVADLRSASDEMIVKKLVCIADSRWQDELRRAAVGAGKLDAAWRIPEPFQENTPDWIRRRMQPWRAAKVIRDYPFGSDFTPVEQEIARGLALLARCEKARMGGLKALVSALGPGGGSTPEWQPALRRMGLESPVSVRAWLERRLLCWALKSTSRD